MDHRTADHVVELGPSDPMLARLALAIENAGDTGLTRTAIRDTFHRHESAARIKQALQSLEQRGLARVEHRATGGRGQETWHATSSVATEATKP